MDIKAKSTYLLNALKTEARNADSEFISVIWQQSVEEMTRADNIIQSGYYFEACDFIIDTINIVDRFGSDYRKGYIGRLKTLFHACLEA